MTGSTLLMHKGVVDVEPGDSDCARVSLECGGYIKVEETPIDGLTILPSGNIQISGRTFDITGEAL